MNANFAQEMILLVIVAIGSWFLGREYGRSEQIGTYCIDDNDPIVLKNVAVNNDGIGSYMQADLPKDWDSSKNILVFIVEESK